MNYELGKWGSGEVGKWVISNKTLTPPATARLSIAERRARSDHPIS
ncbi:hypothetical protein IQ234_03130 [Microcystis aeruginosa LEGE 91341]|nr:hypothetical protein [Microcystis aeruginosa LEGE 91341]